ncbi:cysteine dioxygenase [Rugosimonospora africana]|uniref:Cysteine dioxygenase n=1 Tax=Rugosimonospora africana TaxID=556532 RepID=A0A8J3VR66_9ACTN|nr:cysteine dioxygenase family protein [Rugosimonospora africana]GIH15762.1 cysteine dioxygenase [Rugosimonospora africana]
MLTLPTDRTLAGLAALAEHYAGDPARWPVPPRFTAATRWYARIAATAGHEAWLLTWLPGQSTDLHDHGGATGAFHVVAGDLTEQTPPGSAGTGLVDAQYPAGATRRFGARHIHRIANPGPVPAISVHVYAPALTTMTRYRLDGPVLRAVRVERAGADW